MPRIHTELDVLLDTRLATLIYLDEKEAARAFDLGYRERTSDFWWHLGLDIDQKDYENAYRNRAEGDHILKRAKMTNAIGLIAHMSDQLIEQAQGTPFSDEVTVEINTYPYLLSSQVKAAFIAGIEDLFPAYTKLETSRVSIKEQTPERIDQDYDLFMTYDFDTWLNEHHERLKVKRMPSMIMLSAALYRNEIPKESDLIDDEGNYMCPFAALEYALTEYVSLTLADAKYFSLVDP